MDPPVTPLEARAALNTVARGRRRVIDEIDLPRWYWLGVALGWIGLGLITDLRNNWLSVAATVGFGAVHAAVFPRVMSGRHRTQRLSVSADVAGREAPWLVIGALIALAAAADGAGHPVTVASIVVAVMIVFGGPHLLAVVRSRAARGAASQ